MRIPCKNCQATGIDLKARGRCVKCGGNGAWVKCPDGIFPDPIGWGRRLWPQVEFYDKQKQIIYSVMQNAETVVPAGNGLGKDFVSAFIALYYFLTRDPVIVVTTSVADDHLRVLWGEMGRFIASSREPLDSKQGGPLRVHFREIRKMRKGQVDKRKCYLWGTVSEKGEKLQGHHQTYALLVVDEASGVEDDVYNKASTWAHKMLIIGNPWPCENFFKRAVKGRIGTDDHGGDIPAPHGKWYHRKVIQISSEDSPNVKAGKLMAARGIEPPYPEILPGVKSWETYQRHCAIYRHDPVQYAVSVLGEFYDGDLVKLIPAEWLKASADRYDTHGNDKLGPAALGVDSAEGGDNTVWTVIKGNKVVAQHAEKTEDTSLITSRTLTYMRHYHVEPEFVMFDLGGGGKEHADRLRRIGFQVRGVGFGTGASDPKKHQRGMKSKAHRINVEETRMVYKNRRAELYGILREALSPNSTQPLYISHAILDQPRADRKATLRGQLAALPHEYDSEGKLCLPPKKVVDKTSKQQGLIDIIGCSPDEADSLVCALFALRRKETPAFAGVVV